MKSFFKNMPSVGVSLLVNVSVLLSLYFIHRSLPAFGKELTLESIFTEEMPQEEITRDLQLDTAPAETLNVIAGGTPSTVVGAAAQPAAAPVNVQKAAVMKEVNIRPVMTDVALPSDEMIGQEMGEGEIIGEVGAMVEGYGAAMGIITQEIIRMMRQQRVTVVWLFDESGSLEDDRKEIRENYMRVLDELKIASSNDEELKKGSEQLLTVVASYGQGIHEHTARPTADLELIKAAIDKVPVDTTGEENMCQSIATVINKYKQTAIRGKRKLAVIIVSDESGDDGGFVENAITESRAAKAPLYFLGRESMFGFPYARQRWVDKPTGEEFWIRIRRGPETPYPECLQWNGLQSRWDAQSAGFGPYEQVRMARESGGIFFVLPGEETTLVGQGANDRRKYDFLSMREYQPNLVSRPEYELERNNSTFRQAIWTVISNLNPNADKLLFAQHDPNLNIQNEHFPLDLEGFRATAATQSGKAARGMQLIEQAIAILEKVKPLRAQEATQRWRAGYDLALAQLYIFRLRLYQYLLTMDQHVNNMPKPENPKSNEWNVWWNKKTIIPDEAQYSRLKQGFGLKVSRDEYLEMVKTEETNSIARMNSVITDHPGTPWARRAQTELDMGFGFVVSDRLWDPSGRRNEAAKRVPNL
ncbi:MAG TPA: vWA domain-containing protein [Planctomycetaceae bacterium]|nr:vWA domain-containing protein [Planctomycetaceae bacterium]